MSALCVSASIIDLPTQLDLTYNSDLDLARGDVDPSDDAATTNLIVSTCGPGRDRRQQPPLLVGEAQAQRRMARS